MATNNGWEDNNAAKFAAGQTERLRKAMKTAGVMLVSELTTSTPVDTGRARSNWIVTVGTPTSRTISATAADRAGTPSKDSAATARPQPGEGFYISNNLPYIGRLENGSSDQAPAGMVRGALQSTAKRLTRLFSK